MVFSNGIKTAVYRLSCIFCLVSLTHVTGCYSNGADSSNSVSLSSSPIGSDCSDEESGLESDSELVDYSSENEGVEKTWNEMLEDKISEISLSDSDSNCIRYCFFTDPHMFLPNNSFDFDEDKIDRWLSFLETAYTLSNSRTILCGGDILTNGDSKSQACYKISTFVSKYKTRFENSHLLVGNHDTNYQGDTYMTSGDSSGCTLSQETLNDLIFDGKKSYYWYDDGPVRFYCFDSGIDSDWYSITPYRLEQLHWFANELLLDPSSNRVLFLHMALVNNNTTFTAFMNSLGSIVAAFNEKRPYELGGIVYDFRNSFGRIDYFQAGHSHIDVNECTCGGIPVFTTRSFSSPEIASMPTFDIVTIDFLASSVRCVRIGDGEDRCFSL